MSPRWLLTSIVLISSYVAQNPVTDYLFGRLKSKSAESTEAMLTELGIGGHAYDKLKRFSISQIQIRRSILDPIEQRMARGIYC